jgi:hypothetical protein
MAIFERKEWPPVRLAEIPLAKRDQTKGRLEINTGPLGILKVDCS